MTDDRKSGRADSNCRLPAPKAGALTRLRYAPVKSPMLSPNSDFGNPCSWGQLSSDELLDTLRGH